VAVDRVDDTAVERARWVGIRRGAVWVTSKDPGQGAAVRKNGGSGVSRGAKG